MIENIFSNYDLQREELLARIASELELNSSRKEKMKQSYNSLQELLKKDKDFFEKLEIELYAQGSVRIGTTVKPINGDDFDLDTVLHIYDLHSKYDPSKVYNELVRVIESDPYYSTICEKKDRCVRLNYKNDFHIDILPGCMVVSYNNEKLAIPEKRLKTWSSGNPKGFANWFKGQYTIEQEFLLKAFSNSIVKAEVEAEPLPNMDLYEKSPLQRSVQLIKRYRDIYFEDKVYRVSSIVLTTLSGMFYNGETTIYSTIDNILRTIKNQYNDSIQKGVKFKIHNPVDNDEDFTDSWTVEHYRSFYNFIDDLYTKWESLKYSFDQSGKDYINLFGEGIYKKSLQEQIKSLSKFSKDHKSKISGTILGGTVRTDPQGNLNKNRGVRNKPHHSYGGQNY